MTIEIIIVVCLILLGIALLMAEIFLLPGITVAGVGGAIMLIGSIVYAFYYMGNTAGYITIGANIIVGAGSFIFLIKSKTMDRIALDTDIDATVEQPEIAHLVIGQKGITLSRLNPIGKAEFDNQYIVEAKSVTGEFIDTDQEVEIVKIEKNSVLVQSTNQEN